MVSSELEQAATADPAAATPAAFSADRLDMPGPATAPPVRSTSVANRGPRFVRSIVGNPCSRCVGSFDQVAAGPEAIRVVCVREQRRFPVGCLFCFMQVLKMNRGYMRCQLIGRRPHVGQSCSGCLYIATINSVSAWRPVAGPTGELASLTRFRQVRPPSEFRHRKALRRNLESATFPLQTSVDSYGLTHIGMSRPAENAC